MTGDIRSLTRQFALLTALRWLPSGLVIPVMVLTGEARGLSLAALGGLFALHGVLVAALELPTGGLADAIGRRLVLLCSGVLHLAALLIFAVASTGSHFTVAIATLAVGRALGSGPLEAWYVDSVHAVDRDVDLKPGLARGHTWEALGLGVGAVIGGVLPGLAGALPADGDAMLIRLSIPWLVAGAITGASLVAVMALVKDPEPRQFGALRGAVRAVPATIKAGVVLGVGDAVLRRLFLRFGLVGLVLAAVEILAPIQFADLFGSRTEATAAYGVVVTVAFLGTALGAAVAPTVARLAGSSVRGALLCTLGTAAAIGALAGPGVALAASAYVAFYTFLGGAGPLLAEVLHQRTDASARATVLSVESLVQQGGGVVGSLALPAIAAAAGLRWAWIAGAVALVLAALALVRLPALGRPAASPTEPVRQPVG